MNISIKLEAEAERQLRQFAAQQGATPETVVKQWVLGNLSAPAPVQKNLASVFGQWPDVPNDTELKEELAFLF